MKRLSLGIVAGVLAALLAGCPIYTDRGNYRVCTTSGCFDCPDKTYSGACIPWECATDADCGDGLVCSLGNTCVAVSFADAGAGAGSCATPADCPSGLVCGQDNACHAGDCGGSVGCPNGYVCTVAGGRAQCLSATGAHVDAGSSGWDGSVDASMTPACNADSQCAGGAKCVNGQCLAQDMLCTETTQCIASGESCVDGRCTPQCNSNTPCPTGYSCDYRHARNVCSINPNVCAASSQCQGGSVCVESHCVAPCAGGDADAACPGSQACVNGGCIPNERASFACKNDGQGGPLADTCSAGSICLHGDCYPACQIDAGGCASAMVCKLVTVAQGAFAVCAGAAYLGSDCDPTTGRYCDAGPCIDGYCR
jgi:hypothetical protein